MTLQYSQFCLRTFEFPRKMCIWCLWSHLHLDFCVSSVVCWNKCLINVGLPMSLCQESAWQLGPCSLLLAIVCACLKRIKILLLLHSNLHWEDVQFNKQFPHLLSLHRWKNPPRTGANRKFCSTRVFICLENNWTQALLHARQRLKH